MHTDGVRPNKKTNLHIQISLPLRQAILTHIVNPCKEAVAGQKYLRSSDKIIPSIFGTLFQVSNPCRQGHNKR